MEHVREAPVVPAEVYRYYTDPGTWGQWAHNTAWARAQGPVAAGSKVGVRVRSQPWTYTVRVLELDPGRRVVTEVRPFGVTITSTYEVTATANGSRIHHTISLAGPLERAYLLVRGTYTRMLVEETRRVAELAAGDHEAVGAPSTQQAAAQA
jgi:hypothetical protein